MEIEDLKEIIEEIRWWRRFHEKGLDYANEKNKSPSGLIKLRIKE